MTANAQLFCTVADLVADTNSAGVDEARMLQAIREASAVLQKEIGWFIPVTATRYFKAPEAAFTLFVPPLLAITAIANETESLTGADYILKPDLGHWPDGPYSRLVADPDSSLLYSWSDLENGVTITGRWGKYEKSKSTAATVADTTQQSSSQTTLKLSSAAVVSLGMVLLIESEQQLVTGWEDPTTNATTLSANIATTDESFSVASGAALNVGEIIRIDFEQMKIKDKKTNSINVIRGWNGTARAAHTSSTAVDVYRTVTVERGVNGTSAAVHANGTAISRYLAPDDIQYLTKQIATLIVNKARSGYQGRTGNDQTGVVFYNDAFPRYEMDRIKKSYLLPGYEL